MSTVVIGMGAGRQGAGPLVVDLLRHMNVPDVRLAESDGDPADLVEQWDKADLAVVVTAVDAGGPPGRVRHIGLPDPAGTALDGGLTAHAATTGISAALALGQARARMPGRLMVCGIEIDPRFGDRLTPPVREACQRLATQLSDLVVSAQVW
ncbi:hydrogenase maturation protease [Hamadaea tsunoensis]|uniref:hydrogenase maturation protease n=1 Tax=Hamadaea tsunoensis TaxID=53368 RepID=UPI00041F0DB0|nr:hydrogenase maturation protease [Hamadaea tsunoensis]